MLLDHTTIGKGNEVLVILHGLLGSQRNWMTIGKALSHKRKVLLMDLRNHGRSPWDDDVSLDSMVADVLETTRSLKLDKFCLIGHSLGGKVTMKFSVDHPEVLDRVIVVDIAPRQYPNQLMRDLEAMLSLDLSVIKSRREADMALAMHVPDTMHRQFLLTNLRRESDGSLAWATNLRALYRGMDELRCSPLRIGQRIHLPALFLFGERSSYVIDTDVELVKRHFSKAEVQWIPRAGHNVHTDQPQLTVDQISAFLQG